MSLPQPTLHDAIWLLGQVYLYMPQFLAEIEDMEREILVRLTALEESMAEIAATQARIEAILHAERIERGEKNAG